MRARRSGPLSDFSGPHRLAFESSEVQLQKLRERLRQMSDEELFACGKQVRTLSGPRVGVTPDPREVAIAGRPGCPRRTFQVQNKRKPMHCRNRLRLDDD